ncbi:1-deoxy-D-xylulose-5-phosphate synthase N-terminal domain-containing protein [Streptomyces amakusaensis]|uniref:1-deoxy-D-xylulose-5-phosphate synthase n=1 Tax=Streptomyces amakusaensis TaxID=67271 RepID=A0ABW0AQD4_9ACTN
MSAVPTPTGAGEFPLLAEASDPKALRALPAARLPELVGEIRAFVIEKVAASGGHLGPNLGVVELTVALHRVFASPHDTVLFDIGHQAYVHKILTGRAGAFGGLRRAGGLSGYPSRAESEHDVIENSHASTVLSYADGLAHARRLSGEPDRAVVAVIGDGALTGGMAWEALNNIGTAPRHPLIVVLNDNGRSYAPTTGAVATHLDALKRGTGPEERRNLFTDLGFAYLGPVDGHDTPGLEAVLHTARALDRPVVVHVMTVKGKGYGPAERDDADHLHAVGTIDPSTGRPAPTASPAPLSWTDLFGRELLHLAEERQDLIALTASMLRPTGLHSTATRFPGRVLDVGIAEQHAVTCAAGLATGGYHPVVAIYATFLNRAFDQVLMDVALHRLPVTFVLDRAGITGPDGPSHHGMWDLSLLTMVPGLRIAAPRDTKRLGMLLREAVAGQGPTVLRLPKGAPGSDTEAVARIDGIDILRRSPHRPLDVIVVAVGPMAHACLEAAALLEDDGIGVTVADPGWVHPVNPALAALAARHRLVATVEDGVRTGGIGAAVTQALQDAQVRTPVTVLGLPPAFIPHDTRTSLLGQAGLDGPGIARSIRTHLKRLTSVAPPAGAYAAGSPSTGRTP